MDERGKDHEYPKRVAQGLGPLGKEGKKKKGKNLSARKMKRSLESISILMV